MDDTANSSLSAAPAGLTQIERVVDTFVAPAKTFADVRRNSSWWLPFLISVFFGYAMFAAIQWKVGWNQAAENVVEASPSQSSQLAGLSPEVRARRVKAIALIMEGSYAGLPVVSVVVTAVIAGVLLATINFGFAGNADFWQVFAVCWYAWLPTLIKELVGGGLLLAGHAAQGFNPKNFAPTNVGYFLPADTTKPLLALATSLDVMTIWSLVLYSIGLSIVAGTRRSSGFITVFGWWALIVLFGVGTAAAFP